MIRLSLCALPAALFAGSAFAQDPNIETFEGQIHYGGVYHVAAGYMEPAPATSNLGGSDAIYDNTCLTVIQFTSTLNGSTVIDDGRLPSPTSPLPNVGTFTDYRVKSFVIGYVTRELQVSSGGPGAAMTISFWEDYDACATLAAAGPPTASFTLTGLPGAATQGTATAWAVTIDLTGLEFNMAADADGVYDASPALDTFGWSYSPSGQLGTTTSPSTVGGPIIAPNANPGTCVFGESTYYSNPTATAGKGLDNADAFRRDGMGGQSSGCLFFGGAPAPYGGFYMEINADLADCNSNGIPDADDISGGSDTDLNSNGIPDHCECGDAPGLCGVGTSINGCTPTISSAGVPSASNAGTYVVTAGSMDGQRLGGFFYGLAYAPTNIGAGQGGTSWFCGPGPRQRVLPSFGDTGGTLGGCDGSRSHDLNDYWFNVLGAPHAFGTTLWIQGWNRDSGNPSGNLNITDGIAATMCP